MKYLRQIGLILLVSFIAELVRLLIPAPIPASIYGLIILFLCLQFRIVKLDSIEETGNFLLAIMPLLFVPPTVGLIDKWQSLRSIAAPAVLLIIFGTLATMVATGAAAQFFLRRQDRGNR
ncbi:MAG: CidA/LrgA family protein [Thermoguttaceae bacterium]